MSHWYEQIWAHLILRLGGLTLLLTAWPECAALSRLVHARPDMTIPEFLLGALFFMSASMGVALAIVGPGLWKPARLSARWTRSPSARPKPRP
jgi:hypothetical protein